MLEETCFGKHTQYKKIYAIEGGRIKEVLILSTAKLGRKFHEKNSVIESTLKINISVKQWVLISLLQATNFCVRINIVIVLWNSFRQHVAVNMRFRSGTGLPSRKSLGEGALGCIALFLTVNYFYPLKTRQLSFDCSILIQHWRVSQSLLLGFTVI